MILTMNMGNTHFAIAHRKNNEFCTVSYMTKDLCTADDFAVTLKSACETFNIKTYDITGIILASVVPYATDQITHAVQEIFGLTTLLVNAQMPMDIHISAYTSGQLGNDRIAICEGAIKKHKAPLILFDFGTATTMNVIDHSHHFLGGAIFPGMAMGISALHGDTAQLPFIDLQVSAPLLGTNTRDSILSGAVYGNAAMVDALVRRVADFLAIAPTVLMTGGNARFVIPYCQTPVIYEPDLLMEGLLQLYYKNKKGGS